MLPELEELLGIVDREKGRLTESERLYDSLVAGKQPERIPIAFSAGDEAFNMAELGMTIGEYRSDPDIALRFELKAQSWRLQEFPEEDATPSSFSARIVTECNSFVASAHSQVGYFPDKVGYTVVPALESIKDVGKLKVPRPEDMPSVQRVTRFAEHYMRHLDGHLPISVPVPIMPFTDAAMIRGDTQFIYDLIDHPREARQLLDIAVETEVRVIRYFRKLLGESEPDAVGMADDATSYLSPALYEEFAVPYERMAFEALSKTGRASSIHICGPSMHLLEVIKRELDPESMLISWFGNLAEASRIMPGTILRGNANDFIVKEGTREQIRAHLIECMEQASQCELYHFASGSDGWGVGTPVENIHYAYSVIKEYERQHDDR